MPFDHPANEVLPGFQALTVTRPCCRAKARLIALRAGATQGDGRRRGDAVARPRATASTRALASSSPPCGHGILYLLFPGILPPVFAPV
jgi:hypothetical protein